MNTKLDLSKYYTAAQSAEVLSKNSGRAISPIYVRKLAEYGIFTPIKLSNRINLYPKDQVNGYVVEKRGTKLKRQHEKRRKAKTAAADSTLQTP